MNRDRGLVGSVRDRKGRSRSLQRDRSHHTFQGDQDDQGLPGCHEGRCYHDSTPVAPSPRPFTGSLVQSGEDVVPYRPVLVSVPLSHTPPPFSGPVPGCVSDLRPDTQKSRKEFRTATGTFVRTLYGSPRIPTLGENPGVRSEVRRTNSVSHYDHGDLEGHRSRGDRKSLTDHLHHVDQKVPDSHCLIQVGRGRGLGMYRG